MLPIVKEEKKKNLQRKSVGGAFVAIRVAIRRGEREIFFSVLKIDGDAENGELKVSASHD